MSIRITQYFREFENDLLRNEMLPLTYLNNLDKIRANDCSPADGLGDRVGTYSGGGYALGYMALVTQAVGTTTDRLEENPPFDHAATAVANAIFQTIRS
jgi:hypothetical protein